MFNVTMSGFDKLKRELDDAQRAFSSLDGELATVRFDPSDQQSVEAAIRSMEEAVDRKVAPYRGNALVESIVPQLKDRYRTAILARAKA
jgi:hypothetical protein